MSCARQEVRYLAGFQCPAGGLAAGKAQVISWDRDVYVSGRSKFVHVYSTEKQQIMAAYSFPAEVWHVELVSETRQLYALCARTGIYHLAWDEHGRLLKKSNSVASAGGVDIVSVGPEFSSLPDPAICSFTVAHGILVAASLHHKKWRIALFHSVSPHHEDPTMAPIRELEFSIKPTAGCSRRLEDCHFLPVLGCVCLWKEKGLSHSPQSCQFAVEASLFTPLFGVDAAMLDSPMILCGFPDGQVACFPLKAAGFPSMHLAESTDQSLAPVKILYHLEQPVVFIGATRTEPAASESRHPNKSDASLGCDCIVFLGHEGLMVTARSGEKAAGKAHEFREHHLQAPVSCGACCGSSVYYSTHSDLLSVTVPTAPEQGAVAKTPRHPILSSVGHNVPAVVAMSPISRTPERGVEVLALSGKGRLMACSLNKKGQAPWAGLSCAKAGQRIKELLSGIGTLSDRVSRLKSVVDEKNVSLLDLNHVMGLTRAVLSGQRPELPLPCEVRVSWTRLLQQDSLMASCTLENKTDCSLERGWTLCVDLSAEASDCSTAVSYSFPIERLLPGERTERSFPLSAERSDGLEFPLTIACTLFYSLKGLAAGCGNAVHPAGAPAPPAHREGVLLPLKEHTVDVLQCLRLNSQGDDPCPAASWQTSPWDPAEAFLTAPAGGDSSIGQLRTCPEALCNQGVDYVVPLTASVRVSAMLLNRAIQWDGSGVALRCAVLHWLLSAEVTRARKLSEVRGVTPDGRKLCLRVREVSVSDLSSAGPIPAMEIQIESPHLDALACVHLAVIARLQALVLQSDVKDGSSPDLHLANLQQLFIARESLLKDVQTLRDHLCVEKERSSDTAAQKLLRTYRALRDPGLLLL
ncbi:Fanconi anemia core complex-associated protein 100 [Ascaphus truei]|uniref:Fanconi anemia core complex-associated protein 100 n=1 Tax=Ascaphus truei TaxID=8439 RepID=UPI003F5AA70E